MRFGLMFSHQVPPGRGLSGHAALRGHAALPAARRGARLRVGLPGLASRPARRALPLAADRDGRRRGGHRAHADRDRLPARAAVCAAQAGRGRGGARLPLERPLRVRRRARLRLGGVRGARGAARGAPGALLGGARSAPAGLDAGLVLLRRPLLPGAGDERDAEADPVTRCRSGTASRARARSRVPPAEAACSCRRRATGSPRSASTSRSGARRAARWTSCR